MSRSDGRPIKNTYHRDQDEDDKNLRVSSVSIHCLSRSLLPVFITRLEEGNPASDGPGFEDGFTSLVVVR